MLRGGGSGGGGRRATLNAIVNASTSGLKGGVREKGGDGEALGGMGVGAWGGEGALDAEGDLIEGLEEGENDGEALGGAGSSAGGPQGHARSLRAFSRQADRCIRMFNPPREPEYREVIASWVNAILLFSDHMIKNYAQVGLITKRSTLAKLSTTLYDKVRQTT